LGIHKGQRRSKCPLKSKNRLPTPLRRLALTPRPCPCAAAAVPPRPAPHARGPTADMRKSHLPPTNGSGGSSCPPWPASPPSPPYYRRYAAATPTLVLSEGSLGVKEEARCFVHFARWRPGLAPCPGLEIVFTDPCPGSCSCAAASRSLYSL
jgi:hypothetical protein